MATKQAVTTEAASTEQDAEVQLLDTNAAAVKRLIAKGKERGYITCRASRTRPSRSRT